MIQITLQSTSSAIIALTVVALAFGEVTGQQFLSRQAPTRKRALFRLMANSIECSA